MPIKLIAADLDGTLMRNDKDKTISPYSADVLRRCRERGILLAFATARSERACERARRLLSPEALVTSSGARVTAGDTLLRSAPLPREAVLEIPRFCRGLASVTRISAETEDGRYLVSEQVPESLRGMGDYGHREHYDFAQPIEGGVYKFVNIIEDEADRQAVRDAFPELSFHRYTGTRNCLIAPGDATKFTGLLFVMAHLRIPPSEVAAFGDDSVDTVMLRHCGVGVAMANAIDETKAAADHICPSCDEDGMARWIEENLL